MNDKVRQLFLNYSILRDLMQEAAVRYAKWTDDYKLKYILSSDNVHAMAYQRHVKRMNEIEEGIE